MVLAALVTLLSNVNENVFANHVLNEIVIGLGMLYRKYQKKMVLNSSAKILS